MGGVWQGHKNPEPNVIEALHPVDTENLSKREIVEYLRKVSPAHVLLRWKLLGALKNVMRCINREQLNEVVAEVWALHRTRHGAKTVGVVSEMCLKQSLGQQNDVCNAIGEDAVTASETLLEQSLGERDQVCHIIGEDATSIEILWGQPQGEQDGVRSATQFAENNSFHLAPRFLTAWQLLEEDSDVGSVFCGPWA